MALLQPIEFQPEFDGIVRKNTSGDLDLYETPPFAKAEIYEQNLKTSFIGLYHFLRIRKMVERLSNQTEVDLYDYLPSYAKKMNFNSSPYLASFSSETAKIYWPKVDLKACLTDPESYLEPALQSNEYMDVIDRMSELSQQHSS